jgi:tyrosine-protein phosphatase YwqE
MWWLGGKKVPINLGLELSVEVHNHVLPGLDDGARSMQDALQMIFFWVEMGYQKVITTPHHSTYFPTQSVDIEEKLLQLRHQMQEQEMPIQLTAAAEYLLERELLEKASQLRFFGPKRYLLVELGFDVLPIGWEEAFFALQQQGYTIMIAHPERYAYATPDRLKSWYVNAGAPALCTFSDSSKEGRGAAAVSGREVGGRDGACGTERLLGSRPAPAGNAFCRSGRCLL